MLVELTTSVNDGGFISIITIKEVDDISQIFHPVDIELINNSCLTRILLWYDKALELLFPSTDSNRQGACHRL